MTANPSAIPKNAVLFGLATTHRNQYPLQRIAQEYNGAHG